MGMIMPSVLGLPYVLNQTSIKDNGNRAQDSENRWLNIASYWQYMQRFIDMYISVIKWEGLPEGIDVRQLEMWLLQYGFVGMFYDEDLKVNEESPDGYAVLPVVLEGDFNLYNLPRNRTAYSIMGQNWRLSDTDSVLIFNNYARMPVWYILDLYARRLAEIDRTIDTNVRAQKCSKIIACDRSQRDSFKNLTMQIDGNVYYIYADKNLDVNNINVLDTTDPYVANDLNILKHQIYNECLTFIGIENVNTDKREREITDEVISNMGDVETQRFTRLDARKDAAEKINKRWGLNVSVDFRSGNYIRSGESIFKSDTEVSDMQEGVANE